MALGYLTLEEALPRLAGLDPPPTEVTLLPLLEEIEGRLDIFFNRRLPITEYTHEGFCNWKGSLTLPEYPVVKIVRIESLGWAVTGHDQVLPHLDRTYNAIWHGGQRLSSSPHQRIKVFYEAGIEVPLAIKNRIITVIAKAWENAPGIGDLSFLTETSKDLTNVSVAGVSQSFKVNSSVTAMNQGRETVFDRYFSEFSRYQRKIRF